MSREGQDEGSEAPALPNGPNAHYSAKLATTYDDAWFYADPGFQEALKREFSEHLQLSCDHRLVDVGGGTGKFAAEIRQTLEEKEGRPMSKSILCVDPSEAMLHVAATERVDAVDTLCATATSFFACRDGGPQASDADCIDRIIMKEVIHHIPAEEVAQVCRGMMDALRDGGRFVVMTRAATSRHYPFFEAAHAHWADPRYDSFADHARRAGFRVDISTLDYPVKLTAGAWKRMLRNRFWSTFSAFTDEEIEGGIAELSERWKGDGDAVEFADRLIFIVGCKPEVPVN